MCVPYGTEATVKGSQVESIRLMVRLSEIRTKNKEQRTKDMTGGLVGVISAWDAVTEKIPLLCTKMAKECGVEGDEYHSFLR